MIVLGIAGGTGAGKTVLANALAQRLAPRTVSVIRLDNYYRHLDHIPLAERAAINFDHPDALEFDLLIHHVQQLKAGRAVRVPVYNFITHTRERKTVAVHPTDFLIVEGILVLHPPALLDLMDLKLYVDAPTRLRIQRRIARDVQERGRQPEQVLLQHRKTVQIMFVRFVRPTQRQADLVVPGTGDLSAAVDRVLTALRPLRRKTGTHAPRQV